MRILLMCLLFCVQSAWGAERYFAPNNVTVYAGFEHPETGFNGNRYQIEGLSDIEFALEGQQVSLPQSTFAIDGIDNPIYRCRGLYIANAERDCDGKGFEVNGGTLKISAKLMMEPARLPLILNDNQHLETLHLSPTTVNVSGLYEKDGVQYQFDKTFDVAMSFTRSEVDFTLRPWADVPAVSLIRIQRPDRFDNGFGQFASLRTEVQMRTAVGDGIFDIGDGTLLRLERFRAGPANVHGVERVPTPEQRASFLPGDADLDGAVTLNDFRRLRLSIILGDGRGTWGHGDFNGDLKLDFADFMILADNFGNVRTQAAAVPEPGLFALLLPAVLFWSAGHWRGV